MRGWAYTDVGPVMLLSEASVHNLSSKSEKDLDAKQFRPNIVISDCKAFAEDSWDEIQIGNVRLQRVMSCGRCLFTTVDPDTGTFHRKEPYQTLKSYRLCDPSEKHIYKSSPLFGQLHTVKKTGMVQVGDVVYTVSCKCHSQTKYVVRMLVKSIFISMPLTKVAEVRVRSRELTLGVRQHCCDTNCVVFMIVKIVFYNAVDEMHHLLLG